MVEVEVEELAVVVEDELEDVLELEARVEDGKDDDELTVEDEAGGGATYSQG